MAAAAQPIASSVAAQAAMAEEVPEVVAVALLSMASEIPAQAATVGQGL